VARIRRGAGALTSRILGICGSLRAASSNRTILEIVTLIAPADVEVRAYDGLAALPHFNPDDDRVLDDPRLPEQVRALRAAVAGADALLVSSPEYAHGVPGSLKNALDWLVGGSEMVGKPVALWNTSPHSVHAQAALTETLRTMSATVVVEAEVSIALPRGAGAAALAADPSLRATLLAALDALRRAAVAV
jgi:chromate reductase